MSKKNFIVASNTLTFNDKSLEEYHLVSYQVQKSPWLYSEDSSLPCPGPGSAALPGPPNVIFTALTNFTGIISG